MPRTFASEHVHWPCPRWGRQLSQQDQMTLKKQVWRHRSQCYAVRIMKLLGQSNIFLTSDLSSDMKTIVKTQWWTVTHKRCCCFLRNFASSFFFCSEGFIWNLDWRRSLSCKSKILYMYVHVSINLNTFFHWQVLFSKNTQSEVSVQSCLLGPLHHRLASINTQKMVEANLFQLPEANIWTLLCLVGTHICSVNLWCNLHFGTIYWLRYSTAAVRLFTALATSPVPHATSSTQADSRSPLKCWLMLLAAQDGPL